jgi:hypothetical protein
MTQLIRILTLLTLGVIAARQAPETPAPAAVAPSEGELQQAESIFAFEAIERALDRTNNDLRSLDANVNGLLAVQAAIYAILIDKLGDFSWQIHDAFITAIVLSAVNIVLGSWNIVPEPVSMLAALKADPRARERIIAVMLERAGSNGRLLTIKRVLFWIALSITVCASVAAPDLAVV